MSRVLRVILSCILLVLLCVPLLQAHADPVFQIDDKTGASYQAVDHNYMDVQSNWNAFSMLFGLVLCFLIKQLSLLIPKVNFKRYVYSFVPILKHADHLVPVKCKSFYLNNLPFIYST